MEKEKWREREKKKEDRRKKLFSHSFIYMKKEENNK